MDKQKLEQHKTQLEKQRAKLAKEFAKDQKPTDFGGDIDHFEEESNETEELDNTMAVGATIKNRINEIDAALNKISSSKYGVCEKCGKEISGDVLAISPESRLCKNCKKALAK